jgi:hypothetical protein
MACSFALTEARDVISQAILFQSALTFTDKDYILAAEGNFP